MPQRLLVSLTSLIALIGLSLSACGTEDGSETATEASPSASGSGSGDQCDYPAGGPAAKKADPPPTEAAVSGSVPVTITIGQGEVSATLDADAAPCTVNSFVSLAEQGYFDSTICHRLTTAGIYVLQCGDPTGSGMGGPGYSFADELTGSEEYDAGTLAMANAGPNTNGSQFFIVYDDTRLDPSYTVFGMVEPDGLEVVREVASAGTDTGEPDGAPKEPVEIGSVTVG